MLPIFYTIILQSLNSKYTQHYFCKAEQLGISTPRGGTQLFPPPLGHMTIDHRMSSIIASITQGRFIVHCFYPSPANNLLYLSDILLKVLSRNSTPSTTTDLK